MSDFLDRVDRALARDLEREPTYTGRQPASPRYTAQQRAAIRRLMGAWFCHDCGGQNQCACEVKP